MPFSVLVGAMSCYLDAVTPPRTRRRPRRRRFRMAVRGAGMVAAFIVGIIATTLYNPLSAMLHERSKRLEADMQGENVICAASVD